MDKAQYKMLHRVADLDELLSNQPDHYSLLKNPLLLEIVSFGVQPKNLYKEYYGAAV